MNNIEIATMHIFFLIYAKKLKKGNNKNEALDEMLTNQYLKELDKRIDEKYKKALEDCQIPTGALATLNRTQFYIYCLENKLDIIESDGKEKIEEKKGDEK